MAFWVSWSYDLTTEWKLYIIVIIINMLLFKEKIQDWLSDIYWF